MPSKVNPRFYNTKKWKTIAKLIYIRDEGKCQMCGCFVEMEDMGTYSRIKGAIDHKEELTDDNINDPDIAYNEKNLWLLCHACHNTKTHATHRTAKGLMFNSEGELVKL